MRNVAVAIGKNGAKPGLWWLVCLAMGLGMSGVAFGGPTQSDVFKSIQESVGDRHDVSYTPVILLGLGGGVVMGVLVLMNRREQKKVTVPSALNHSGKLAKELLKEVNLKPAEMKQLRLLADSIRNDVGETLDPLALLLCPSLLAKGVNTNPSKLDRKTVAQMVRRMRLNQVGGQG